MRGWVTEVTDFFNFLIYKETIYNIYNKIKEFIYIYMLTVTLNFDENVDISTIKEVTG
nr:MAG TPA: hypothetical protein [Caudoviricetes sp.]